MTEQRGNRFGTFGGVFTPAILTILGVIMFMRANFVVGQAGIISAVLILLLSKTITLSTSFSIAAISTNMRVRGGGSYFLISRSLGAEYGGAVGLALFTALALSVPFYILGFTEALVRSFPVFRPYFMYITLSTAFVLFIVAYYGAGLALRIQYVIMAFLFMAIAAFMGGALQHFSFSRFAANLAPDYTQILPGGPSYSFWIIFAIYFPAVTGIDAGVNMSGDLKDPGKSIPRGTFAAVLTGFFIYLAQILLCGGAWPRQQLSAMPFELLKDNAALGLDWLVIAGVVAATLSSALGSYLGAPRVLQAVSRDRLLPFLHPFAKGSGKGNEPRRALLLVLLITVAVLLWAGDKSGGTALNAVAAIITMFFLCSYGTINLAALTESISENPSFRPKFKQYHWSFSLLGAAGCGAVSFLINWMASLAAILIISALFWHLKKSRLKKQFGDARRGLVYNAVHKNLLRLELMADDVKNWRPTVLLFSGHPGRREILVNYALWLAAGRGLVFLADILQGEFTQLVPRRKSILEQLRNFCHEKNLDAFPVVAIAGQLEKGVIMLLQSTSIGPIRPNVVMLGWAGKYDKVPAYLRQLRAASALGMSIVLFYGKTLPIAATDKRIDIWWMGRKNGDLMVLLAYLLTRNWQWEDSVIRICRLVKNKEGEEPAYQALNSLIDQSRVQAEATVIVNSQSFETELHHHSSDADCVILGFELPEEDHERTWHGKYQGLLPNMPTTLLVNSRGEEKLM